MLGRGRAQPARGGAQAVGDAALAVGHARRSARSAAPGCKRFSALTAERARAAAAQRGATHGCRSGGRCSRRCARARCSSTTCSGPPDGGRNPAWDAIGYDGPLGTLRPGAAEGADRSPRSSSDTTLDCDVVIVGSGAGGGAAAGRARRRGARRDRGRVGRLLRRSGLRRLGVRRADPVLHGCAAARPTTRASGCWRARAWAAGRSSTTRPRSALPTTCAPSGRRTACRRSPPTSTRRASTRCASGSASTRSTTSPPRASRSSRKAA